MYCHISTKPNQPQTSHDVPKHAVACQGLHLSTGQLAQIVDVIISRARPQILQTRLTSGYRTRAADVSSAPIHSLALGAEHTTQVSCAAHLVSDYSKYSIY